jgi:hypothetical protein
MMARGGSLPAPGSAPAGLADERRGHKSDQAVAGRPFAMWSINARVALAAMICALAACTGEPPGPSARSVVSHPCGYHGLTFFDWDSANLSPRSQEVLPCVAASADRPTAAARFEVAGHADRSGPADYNLRLSQRRAEAVADELVRNGVARERISVSAYGETRPLVPTPDGVREPQNRRVEMVVR